MITIFIKQLFYRLFVIFSMRKLQQLLIGMLLIMPFLANAQMTYSSSTVTQNTAKVLAGGVNQQVIGVKVTTSGSTNALNVTRFNFSSLGTTQVADISNARVYYTGTSASFTTSNQFGSVVTNINNDLNITGSQTLAAGTNYFWLTYDIRANATVGNLVDAGLNSFVIGGITRYPGTPNPDGAREIGASINNVYTIDKNGSGSRNFSSFNAAITFLNNNTVPSGGILFNVASGQIFDEAPLIINATGTNSNPVVFQKSGTSANPVLQGTNGTGTADNIITINAGDYITFNGIDFKDNPANTTTTTKMERGVFLNNTAGNGSMYNTVMNSNITLDKSNTNLTYGIYANNTTATSAAGANSYNKFYGNKIQNVAYGIFLNGHSTYYDNSNELGSGNFSSSISDFTTVAIMAGQQTNGKVFNNVISNGTSTANIKGIHITGASSTVDIFDNNIASISSSSLTGIIIGTHVESANTTNIYNNHITNLAANAGNKSSASIQAIEVDAGAGNIYSNIISNINNAVTGPNTTGITNGIFVKGGTTLSIYNNMVSDLRANGSNANPSVRGISLEGGTTINLFFNSIHLSGTAETGGHSSATLYITAAPGSVNMRNNILFNKYNLTSTGTRAVAVFKSTTSYANIASTSNNNLVLAGTPSTRNLLFYDNTNADQTLAAYKTRLGPTRESASVSVDPLFVSATDLHLNPCSSPSKGVAITNITQDIDGETRAASPTIGADEVGPGSVIARWSGSVSTDWNNSGNWSCNLVPTSSSEVIIPATATRQPTLSSGTGFAKIITIDFGASLTISGGSISVNTDINLNGTLNVSAAGSLNVTGSLTLNTNDNNALAQITNNGTVQVTGATIVNEGNITNKGTLQVGTNLTVNTGSGKNVLSNGGTVKVAANFNTTSNVSVENIGTMEVTGNLNTSSTFLNNGLDGVGSLVVQGDFVNNINGHFTNLLGMATIKNFYNKALIDGDLGSFAISGISENAINAVIRGGVDICDSSLSPGSKFVDTNNGLIEWGTYDTSAEDGTVTQCGGQLTALPVTLNYFKATLRQNQAELNWQTANERNSASFIVERSVDGKNFIKIGVVQAAGTSNQLRSYTYKDLTTPAGVVYYRLKQIDLDNTYKYSSIASVSTRAATFSLNVFPNPLSNQDELQIWLSGHARQPYLLEVLDLQGRLVYQQQVELKNNIQELFIPTQLTAQIKGLCLIRCTDLKNNYSQTIKVVVK